MSSTLSAVTTAFAQASAGVSVPIGVLGIFSDWATTVTYYANCMGIRQTTASDLARGPRGGSRMQVIGSRPHGPARRRYFLT